MSLRPNSDGSVGSHVELPTTQRKSVGKRPLKRAIFLISGLLIVAFLGGFIFFLSEIERYPEIDPQSVSGDGIAVLTGGFARLAPAVELLKMQRGERLLISGVNPRNSDGSLKNALNIDDALYDCCVDVDQDAMDTIGNAVGIAHWANSKNYSSLIIVTNDYHMPRSLLEIENRLGNVELIPFSVRNRAEANENLSKKLDRYRVLSGEYLKFVATQFRRVFNRSGSPNGTISAGVSTGW